MKFELLPRAIVAPRTITIATFVCSLGMGQFSYAQNSAEFADDFSVNSILYRAESRSF